MELISSKQNKLIKLIKKLENSKNILKTGMCLVESEKVVTENLGSLFSIFVVKSKLNRFTSAPCTCYEITDEIAKYISTTVTTDGVFGIMQIKQTGFTKPHNRFLVLDHVQDPANLGAIVRSANAFNYKDIYLIDCVNPYSPKCIRSSMGHVFNVNFNFVSTQQLQQQVQSQHLNLICADMDGVALDKFSAPRAFGIVLGSEGQGVSQQVKDMCKVTVQIPMQNNVESLNVAVSGAILMYELM